MRFHRVTTKLTSFVSPPPLCYTFTFFYLLSLSGKIYIRERRCIRRAMARRRQMQWRRVCSCAIFYLLIIHNLFMFIYFCLFIYIYAVISFQFLILLLGLFLFITATFSKEIGSIQSPTEWVNIILFPPLCFILVYFYFIFIILIITYLFVV